MSGPARLSPHFTVAELSCRCGCGAVPPAEFVYHLEALRLAFDSPMTITSGARCAEHNVRVSATRSRTGPHTRGAVDVHVYGSRAHALAGCAHALGWTGFGYKQHGDRSARFLHLDRLPHGPGCPRPWTWSYP